MELAAGDAAFPGHAHGRLSNISAATLPRSLQPHITLRVHLPATYPSQHPPVFELSCDILSVGQLGELAAELEALFAPGALFSWGVLHPLLGMQGTPATVSLAWAPLAQQPQSFAWASPPLSFTGEVVLWQWVEHLRERWTGLAPKPAAEDAAADAAAYADAEAALAAELQAAELLESGDEAGAGERRQRQARGLAAGDEELERALAEVAETVVHGEPFTERRSTFQVGGYCRMSFMSFGSKEREAAMQGYMLLALWGRACLHACPHASIACHSFQVIRLTGLPMPAFCCRRTSPLPPA